jgi:dipeptidyl aminopeptidase/acylaminoacyl peptidase
MRIAALLEQGKIMNKALSSPNARAFASAALSSFRRRIAPARNSRALSGLTSIGGGIVLVLAAATARAEEPVVSPRALVSTVELSNLAISPDGRTVAFREERVSVDDNSDSSAWFVEDLDAPGTPMRVADGGSVGNGKFTGTGIGEPRWSPDSRWFYFRAVMDGEVQVWRAARAGDRSEQVTHDDSNIQAFDLSAEGSRLIYSVGATREQIARAEVDEYRHGIRFDQTISGYQNLYRSMPLEGQMHSERGPAQTLLADTAPSYRAVDLASGSVSTATKEESDRLKLETDAHNLPSVALSTSAKATVAGKDPATRVTISSLDGKTIGECGACSKLTIDTVAWHGPDELLLTVRDDPDFRAQSLYLWNREDDKLRRVVATDGLMSGGVIGGSITIPCASGQQYAVCAYASPLVPPRLERIDLADGARRTIYAPNAALAADIAASVRVENLSWTDASGTRFAGHLILPRASKPGRLPLFINYYVCPGFLKGAYGGEWPLISMAGDGIASLCVNHPPLVDYNPTNYDTALSGVRAIIKRLSDQSLIDPGRVGMGGLSFGSEVTTWIAGHSKLLAAASIASGQGTPDWYWQSALQPGFQKERAERYWGLGWPDDPKSADAWRRVSAAYYAASIRAPYLMQTPEGEFRVNTELYARLIHYGTPTDFWIFPEELHQKTQPAHLLSVNERNLDWFRFWLQRAEDPAPGKSAQYARWREMRAKQCKQLSQRALPSYCSSPAGN